MSSSNPSSAGAECARKLPCAYFEPSYQLVSQYSPLKLQQMGRGAWQTVWREALERRYTSQEMAARGETRGGWRVSIDSSARGETSGELDNMLTRAADYQERELTSTVQTMVGLLGPLMLLTMAGFVILIVLAVMLPIMQMNNFMAG